MYYSHMVEWQRNKLFLSILFHNLFNLVLKRQIKTVFAIFFYESSTEGTNFQIMFIKYVLHLYDNNNNNNERTLIGTIPIVTMAQSTANWSNTHTQVDHTHSLTHLHQDSYNHFVTICMMCMFCIVFNLCKIWTSEKPWGDPVHLHRTGPSIKAVE